MWSRWNYYSVGVQVAERLFSKSNYGMLFNWEDLFGVVPQGVSLGCGTVMLPRSIQGHEVSCYHLPLAWGNLVSACRGSAPWLPTPSGKMSTTFQVLKALLCLWRVTIGTHQSLRPPSMALECSAPGPLNTLWIWDFSTPKGIVHTNLLVWVAPSLNKRLNLFLFSL